MLSVRDSVVSSRFSKIRLYMCGVVSFPQALGHCWCWTSGLPQEISWAVKSAAKCAHHMMGCAPAGSRDVSAALGCGWGVRGTEVGPGSTAPPYIYLEVL